MQCVRRTYTYSTTSGKPARLSIQYVLYVCAYVCVCAYHDTYHCGTNMCIVFSLVSSEDVAVPGLCASPTSVDSSSSSLEPLAQQRPGVLLSNRIIEDIHA